MGSCCISEELRSSPLGVPLVPLNFKRLLLKAAPNFKQMEGEVGGGAADPIEFGNYSLSSSTCCVVLVKNALFPWAHLPPKSPPPHHGEICSSFSVFLPL